MRKEGRPDVLVRINPWSGAYVCYKGKLAEIVKEDKQVPETPVIKEALSVQLESPDAVQVSSEKEFNFVFTKIKKVSSMSSLFRGNKTCISLVSRGSCVEGYCEKDSSFYDSRGLKVIQFNNWLKLNNYFYDYQVFLKNGFPFNPLLVTDAYKVTHYKSSLCEYVLPINVEEPSIKIVKGTKPNYCIKL